MVRNAWSYVYHNSYSKEQLLVQLSEVHSHYNSRGDAHHPNSIAHQFAVTIKSFLSFSNIILPTTIHYATYCHTLNSWVANFICALLGKAITFAATIDPLQIARCTTPKLPCPITSSNLNYTNATCVYTQWNWSNTLPETSAFSSGQVRSVIAC